MTIDRKELERLDPEERIKRLKHLEVQRKKEVNEIEDLIKESEKQIRTRRLAEEITPEQRPINISTLFEVNVFNELEIQAKQEPIVAAGKIHYLRTQTYNDYSKLREFHGIVAGGSSLTEEQLAAIGEIGQRLSVAEKYLTDSEKTASKLDSNRVLLYKLMKETGIN